MYLYFVQTDGKLLVTIPLECASSFCFDLMFPLLSPDYAHNVNMSDSEFGTNGSDRGKSLAPSEFQL